jgi:nucleoside-diphosphate-sugar epimerase
VTGGAGFLGSHIARRLEDEGEVVSIADNLSSGSKRNLKDLGVTGKVLIGDLRDSKFAMKALRGAETVFHFAAEVGSVAYLHGSKEREFAALQANLVIDANVLAACAARRVRTVVYASSVSVYPFGRQLGPKAVFREEDAYSNADPEGGYGWSKFVGEKEAEMVPSAAVGVARIFHAYGKNIYLRPDRSQVMASLIRKALRYPKEGFEVWGDGTQRRCFVHVDDVMDALFALRRFAENRGSLTVNVGSTEEVTVGELARRVVELSGKEIPVAFDTTKPVGALNRTPDLAKAERDLGWRPKVRLQEGLPETFSWAKTRLG